MAAPGKIAWLMASPIRLMRRSIRNTPMGGAPSDSARQPTSARRMKANSMKGWVTASIMPAAARERFRRGRRSRHARRTLRPIAATSARLAGVSTLRVSPQATTSRAISSVIGKYARTCSMSCKAASTVRPSPCQRRISAMRSAMVLVSTARNGSSSRMSEASCSNRRANSTRWNWPPDSAPDGAMPEVLQADGGERAGDIRVRARHRARARRRSCATAPSPRSRTPRWESCDRCRSAAAGRRCRTWSARRDRCCRRAA